MDVKDFNSHIITDLNARLYNITKKKISDIQSDEILSLFEEIILALQSGKKAQDQSINYQETFSVFLKLLNHLSQTEHSNIVKICEILNVLLQTPQLVISGAQAEQTCNWLLSAFKETNELNLTELINCLASCVQLREFKIAKGLAALIGRNGVLFDKVNLLNSHNSCSTSALRVLCNFTNCPGEKDWSSVSKELIEVCLTSFLRLLEQNITVDHHDYFVLKALTLCFQGLENIFVRFHTVANPYLNNILGLGKSYIAFGMPGHILKFIPLLPSAVPLSESTIKTETGRTPKVRKNRTAKAHSVKNKKEENAVENPGSPSIIHAKINFAKSFTLPSSSDSEVSDTEANCSTVVLKDSQAKVRVSALQMLSASFKFCEQRLMTSYWSAFLPDSSQPLGSRHSLITSVLKDPSAKVRCNALSTLSSLLQAIQPTLAMASFQEKKVGSFIPFSQTIAESVIAVQRSLLLSLAAEQSTTALIQVLKCLAIAANVFPYEKLPIELASKTVQKCTMLLDHKDLDVKVACLCVLRILLCTHSSHTSILQLFWDGANKKCWFLENCLKTANSQCGFPLTLECLLVIGEVTRSNISLAQPYIFDIVSLMCKKIREGNDTGVQIRAIKCLILVCSSVLQEMEKDENDQIITQEEGVKLWVHVLRFGLADILQSSSDVTLRAETCSALATIGTQIFECLPRELRILFVTLALACASEPDSSIRAAALRTLGFAVTFNTLNDDASFLLDCSEHILPALRDLNPAVAMNASWALGNLADTLEKQNCLLDELPSDFLTKLIEAASLISQGQMKVRCNGIRALGIFLKIIDVPVEQSATANLLDQAITIIAKQAVTGNFMKNRWNSCYACGNVFQNHALLSAFPHWMEKLLECLLSVFRSCSNYKVRISAANALLHLYQRDLIGNFYFRIWSALLDTLSNSEQVDDFSEFQHRETMCKQICNSLCKLIELMTRDDLNQLYDIITQHYDVCSAQFSVFLKSLLPDQLEHVMEASNHLKQFSNSSQISEIQSASLELLQDLIKVPP